MTLPRRWQSLAGRMMLAQVLVITAAALTLLATAWLVAPGLFHFHLSLAGEENPEVLEHCDEAFVTAFRIAITAGGGTALLAAGFVSWFLVRRVSRPLVQLVEAADAIAAGKSSVDVPAGGFSTEMQALSTSFERMAGRLAEVDASRARLLADLAHELRTPLATLEAYLEGMEDGVVPMTEASWATARLQVDRLRRLSEDVRDVAAAQEHALHLDPHLLAVADVARSAVDVIAPRAASADVVVRVTALDEGALVFADRDRLGQVVGNLLENAVRHTPPGGRVEVSVRVRDETVAITVTDTGPGIAPDERERVFDRFFRSDPSRTDNGSGGGLGLTIARAIVAGHGGRIEAITPASGTGACLRVTLPRAVGMTYPAGRSSAAESPTQAVTAGAQARGTDEVESGSRVPAMAGASADAVPRIPPSGPDRDAMSRSSGA